MLFRARNPEGFSVISCTVLENGGFLIRESGRWFVAPRRREDQPKRSFRRWLEIRLDEQHGACNGLADKLLRGGIPGEKGPLPVTGVNLRAFFPMGEVR